MNSSISDLPSAILIITDAPPSIEFGIDCTTYETGPKFSGVSSIPPGVHFIYYSTGMGSRQGYFINASKGEVVVNAWDSKNEELLPFHNLNETSLDNLLGSLSSGELNSNLGPYPIEQHHLWINMTNLITKDVLSRAKCEYNTILYPGDDSDITSLDAATTVHRFKNNINELSNKVNEQMSIIPFHAGTARVAQFIDINAVEANQLNSIQADKDRGSKITKYMMDKSDLMEYLLKSQYNNSASNLLGELQLSFMLFMLLYSYPGLTHWKLMINTICSSERFLSENPKFTSNFMKILYTQLNFAPTDFFENELSKDSFLKPSLSLLFSALQTNDLILPNKGLSNQDQQIQYIKEKRQINETLREHKKRLLTFLRKKFNLFEDHDYDKDDNNSYNLVEEDMPTFVDESEVKIVLGSNWCNDNSNNNQINTNNNESSAIHGDDFTENKVKLNAKWSEIDSAIKSSSANFNIFDSNHDKNLEILNDDSMRVDNDDTIVINNSEMSLNELEIAKYSWRYPLVYESMLTTNGKEDMVMTAMRIIDEIDVDDNDINDSCDNNNNSSNNSNNKSVKSSPNNNNIRLRKSEAMQFIEFEVSKTRSV